MSRGLQDIPDSVECLLTCVVLSLQVHVTQLVDIADVHLLLVNFRFVEILWKKKQSCYF